MLLSGSFSVSGFSLPRILMLTSPADVQSDRVHVIHECVTLFASQMPCVVGVAEMGFGDI